MKRTANLRASWLSVFFVVPLCAVVPELGVAGAVPHGPILHGTLLHGQVPHARMPAPDGRPALADEIDIRDPWVAEALPTRPITAAYLVIENGGETDDALVEVETEVAEVCELHTMERQGQMMRMRRVEKIDLPAGATVELRPGGFHIMLINLTSQLKEGDTADLVLRFASGKEMIVSAPVKKRGA